MSIRHLTTVLGLSLLPILPANADASGDRYNAYSTTAESITGNIEMDDFGITFQNGETLAFDALVADHFTVDGSDVPASVYSVETPGDPELENGNRLCGSGDVTYIANWATADDLSIVAVFTGDAAPNSSDEMCASYTYGQ